ADPAAEDLAAPADADVLVVDAGAAFVAGGLRGALDTTWTAVRAVANAAWIEPERPGGKVLLVAPAPGPAHAEAVRAGCENLARTLSIEWARFGIRIVAVLPGPRATEDDRDAAV